MTVYPLRRCLGNYWRLGADKKKTDGRGEATVGVGKFSLVLKAQCSAVDIY